MNNNRADYIILVGLLIFLILIFTGWTKNIIKLSDCDFEEPYKAEILHAVGLVPPIGAIVGWMDFGK